MQKPKVKQISDKLWEITELGHMVSCQVKKGRRILTCTCTNHTKFCNENPLCYHKQLVLEYISTKPILDKLNQLINEYKGFENNKFKIESKMIVNDLEMLKRSIEK